MGTDEVSLHKDLRASKSHNTEHEVKRVTAAIPVISYVNAAELYSLSCGVATGTDAANPYRNGRHHQIKLLERSMECN